MAQHGVYQLERSQDQRICVRHSKRENKGFKNCIGKEEAMVWTHFEKRGRGKLRIMLLNDIKTNEKYEMIKCRAFNRENLRMDAYNLL